MVASSSTLAALYSNRFCYGPRTGDTTEPTASNAAAWLAAQLAVTQDPADVLGRLGKVTLTTNYTDTNGVTHQSTGPLWSLKMSEVQLMAWALANSPQSQRPYLELCCARWVRSVWSTAQLRETMADFWHNHFSIQADVHRPGNATITAYDQMIRANALGNFRTLLGATAKSCAMMASLDLATNTKGQPNENYAREVMELHTLGIDAYLGLTTPSGMATSGYSDADVTQAARVLTGWTIVNGSFAFLPAHHDTGTKTLLGMTLTNNGQAEGEAFLDCLAAHPATARHIAKKLYVRFVSDTIPANSQLVPQLAALFQSTVKAPNQIAQLISLIANSSEFLASTGAKVRTPVEVGIAWLRAVGTEFDTSQTSRLDAFLASMGAKPYAWPTPDGMPDTAANWLSTASMIRRWMAPEWICNPANAFLAKGGVLSLGPFDAATSKPSAAAVPAFVQSVAQAIVPQIGANSLAALKSFAQQTGVLGSAADLASATSLAKGVGNVVAAALSLPEFQLR